jgi:3-phosphoshikimate 1-carboxyvinyltransferase
VIDTREIRPARTVRGTIRVPGDKSISHRAAMLSALASGESTIEGFLRAEDCMNTLRAVGALGAAVGQQGDRVTVRGTGGRLAAPRGTLDLGNSGTGVRLLAGLLAGQPFVSEMTGDASLLSRPMRRIKEPLEKMGARVELLGPNGCGPVRIHGGNLRAIEYRLPVASAQVKSCVLLAGLFARGRTAVVEPRPTRDHTERMLRAAGVAVKREGLTVSVEGAGGGTPAVRAREWVVPGDFSSGAFWMAAAACRPGAEIVVERVGLNPGRTAFLDVLRRMGAEVEVAAAGDPGAADDEAEEPSGSVRIRGRTLSGTEVGGNEIPNLIDELPLVAVLGALASGRTVIRDAGELRVKESDRIEAMARALAEFGAAVEERADGMVVEGGARLRGGGQVDSRGDHRIAMAGAILGLFAEGPTRILRTACTETSYPGFWDELGRLSMA